MSEKQTVSFPKKVWETMSGIDCSKHVEKKGGLSYLSWANAWTYLMVTYPDSSFEFQDDVIRDDGSVEVWTSVTIAEGEATLTRRCPLPVMDFKNNSIPNPSSRQISDNRMRCLVKNLALFGLALYLYRGEDIPRTEDKQTKPVKSAPRITQAQAATIRDELAAVDADEAAFCKYMKVNEVEGLAATAYESAVGIIERKRKA